ncbi:MAG: undecaprenyldiphospho-muramoylpentapeptide beta-N-acetylglucosaminyltransferase [Lachnospiraceae bacterium]|uniref:undecaprenyldiphospho-muramoylpentapeptide beta-N-acetylglucosaminyltransferase n=1 Tax=Falcatimonas sp. MSJ-15 TaxID=2841515 RepID=UPI001C10D3C2|nr:undecaprenyldiphospho-muramoylpentapeptide beta-N-acetylglucosaminyltransferase [Falcatimonas sp. MSJ-15]MBQ5734553.1 undecaprenyldiphospho-muramoylpentapeptide beta-N-acetylglucosaminyltransferase [Lachnospiraceae bacterium]MBU5470926.1 undecaprenyldiphospho-muramoylpentapeptide beta-N-acetylglucosaminyltransferase [Falcatimonas sp. MSJ-15]MEE0959200.1 undecaprenyldiphospho-muramoylpentapeptide beta-N-acetylglucosaminyltransferase [Lachnospiraceae bacterium]
MKKIILTGGGTAGHVTPNIALLPKLKEMGFDVSYIGSYEGMEKKLIEEQNIPYYGISSGKLRRYKSIKNLSDPFRVIKGFFEACSLMRKIKPDVIFSKGGFVVVPVVLAAKLHRVPIVIHESDMTPGLATKISIPCATKVCCNFPETVKMLPEKKAVLSGSPIRKELLSGNKENAYRLCGFDGSKPILLVVGGSTGSANVNNAIRSILDRLLVSFDIIHLCGKGKTDASYNDKKGYVQFEYAKDELRDYFAASDIVVSRAGANAICELLAIRKPNLLIPLSARASRGDQILNANSFKAQGYSEVIDEDDLNDDLLYNTIMTLYKNKDTYIKNMDKSSQSDAVKIITELLYKTAK